MNGKKTALFTSPFGHQRVLVLTDIGLFVGIVLGIRIQQKRPQIGLFELLGTIGYWPGNYRVIYNNVCLFPTTVYSSKTSGRSFSNTCIY